MLQRLRAAIFQAISARVFYGWVILAVAALIMFGTGPGQSHLIGLLPAVIAIVVAFALPHPRLPEA